MESAFRARLLFGALVGLLILVLAPSGSACRRETTGESRPTAVTGALEGHSNCKDGAGPSGDATAESRDCVAYMLSSDGMLLLTHVNAAFNCCPDDLTAHITVVGDTITIREREVSARPCSCLCLYDLNYRFKNVEPGTYTLTFVEPYANGSDEPLTLTVDPQRSTPGRSCVERSGYPWNTP